MTRPRVLVLGGGFGGLAAARALVRSGRADVQLVDRHNVFVFSPLLAEVATGSVSADHAVVPLRRYLRTARPLQADIVDVDFGEHRVHVRYGGAEPRDRELDYDQLVLALGSETDFLGIPGLAEHALTLDTVGDALTLRNRVLDSLEQAELESDDDRRRTLLTFVVGGGSLTGVEVAGALAEYLRRALPSYPRLRQADIRVVLVETKGRLLPELRPRLGQVALREVSGRGVDVRLETSFEELDDDTLGLSSGETVTARTVVWAGGVRPAPLVDELLLDVDRRGRIIVDETLGVRCRGDVWALGDCAAIPDGRGGTYPATAQHALREGRHAADNVLRRSDNLKPRELRDDGAGMLVALGERRAIGEVHGRIVSGLAAWALWRGLYLAQLPTPGRRVRVAIDWLLGAFTGPTLVQLPVSARVRPGEQRAVESAAAEPLARERG